MNSKRAGITEHALLVTVEKVASGHDIVDVGCRGIDAVDKAKRAINSNVHLYAEVSLISFFGSDAFPNHAGRSHSSWNSGQK